MSIEKSSPIYQTRSTRVLEPRDLAPRRRGRRIALVAAGLLALIVVATLIGQGLRVATQPLATTAPQPDATREQVLDELAAAAGRPTAPTSAPQPTTAAPATLTVAGTAGAGLKLRDAPGLAGGLLLVLPEGSQVAPTGQTRSSDGMLWAEVGAGVGVTGWAAVDYLAEG